MKIDNQFMVAQPLAQTWLLLVDIPAVVPCIPGAQLVAAVDERHFKVLGSVRLGPVQLAMSGDVELTELDEAGRVLLLVGRGRDGKGRGTAQARIRLSMREAGAALTEVSVQTDLELAGAIAQYGRGTGLVQAVAQQIIGEFARNLEGLAAARSAPAAAVASTQPPAAAAVSLPALLWRTLRAALARHFAGARRER